MKPERKKRLLIITLILVGMSIATGLIFVAVGSNMNHFYEIKDIKSGNVPLNKQIRIGGMVANNSLKRKQGTLKVEFLVTDYIQNITVKHDGILPGLFKEGQGVMATGKLISPNEFVATEILAKHDENYMPTEVQQQLEKSGMLLKNKGNKKE